MRNGPLTIPSLRQFLLKVHKDLFSVDDRITAYEGESLLSDFEKLVLVLEDRRYFKHFGIDWKSVAREVIRAVLRRRHGGASTIDMQFVRTATGYREIRLGRKIYEMLLAFIVQYRYSKLQILRSYLECAFFGSGIYGCYSASHLIYSKPPGMLDKKEAAELASMLVYPKPLNPGQKWHDHIAKRSNYGLAKLDGFEKTLKKFKC